MTKNESEPKRKKSFFGQIDPIVFLPAFCIMTAVALIGLFYYQQFLDGLIAIYNWATDTFGWTYTVLTVINLVALIVILFHPVGKIRLGGPNAKPELSTFNWFAITLTSTIGISLIMWGSVEPIVHFMNPPSWAGVEPGSEDAATFALSTGYIHWSFNQYALYTFAAVAVAIVHFNYNRPLSVASGMYFAIGDNKLLGKLADALCLLVIVGGVATSLGIGINQLASGIEYSFGIEPSAFGNILITLVIVLTYSLASVSGIKKGISYISQFNVWLFFGLLLFTYIVGPTNFINKLSIQSLGDFLNTGIKRTMMLSPISGDTWISNWTLNFYIANAAYAPIMGVFLAKLGRGRTLRQFVGVNLGVCSIFNMIWFNIFGGASIYSQIHGFDLYSIMQEKGLQSAAFAFFQKMPLGVIIVPLFTLAIFLSFVTMAESMTTAMAAISMRGGLSANQDEPNTALKLIWGFFVGILAYYLLGLMGVDVIKYTYMVFGFPIFIVMTLMAYSLLKCLFFPKFTFKDAFRGMFHTGNPENEKKESISDENMVTEDTAASKTAAMKT